MGPASFLWAYASEIGDRPRDHLSVPRDGDLPLVPRRLLLDTRITGNLAYFVNLASGPFRVRLQPNLLFLES